MVVNVLTHICGRLDPVRAHATLMNLNWAARRLCTKEYTIPKVNIPVTCSVWGRAVAALGRKVRGHHYILCSNQCLKSVVEVLFETIISRTLMAHCREIWCDFQPAG